MTKDSEMHRFTEMVVKATSESTDPRMKQIMASLIRHLHGFVIDVSLTLDELVAACAFMVRAGKISDEVRDEFNLISNVLGVEVLVDMISHAVGSQTSVLGPMYLANAPQLPAGASIVQSKPADGETVFIEGHIYDAKGRPVAGATLDVWQASTNGLYDVQDPQQPKANLRGMFTTDSSGYYSLVGLRPTAYPIPEDGPGGDLLRILGRHPMRPAHIHFIVKAPGKRPIISQLYDASCKYLANDSIFAVKDALILKFEPAKGRGNADLYVQYDWKLEHSVKSKSASEMVAS
jgi:catechol 1,2-dioxygenase